jgi:hypothetical protein
LPPRVVRILRNISPKSFQRLRTWWDFPYRLQSQL